MKITVCSDIHNQQNNIKNIPKSDLLIISGDMTGMGNPEEIIKFNHWLGTLDFPKNRIVCIAGNHDLLFETNNGLARVILDNCIYLENEMIEIDGYKIYGSPHTPEFFSWAFNLKRGEEIAKNWEKIPNNVDILITHGPPYGILDQNIKGEHCGCEELLKKVKEIEPRVHIFGHIHQSSGKIKINDTLFINASILDDNYEMIFELKEIEI